MAIKIHREKRKTRHADLKPMINLVFLLLIFFMITTTFDFVEEGQIKINFEVSGKANAEDFVYKETPNMFMMLVNNPSNVELNGNNISLKDAIDEVRSYKEHKGNIELVISVADKTVTQDLVSTIDQLYLAGIHEFKVKSNLYDY